MNKPYFNSEFTIAHYWVKSKQINKNNNKKMSMSSEKYQNTNNKLHKKLLNIQ